MSKQIHWSERKNSINDYIPASYYDTIIKDYVFKGLTDLELFQEYLLDKNVEKILELGSGSGRTTEIILKYAKYNEVNVADLSNNMINFTKKKFLNHKNIKYHNSDHIDFMESTIDKYDLVCSMWSLSHSIHTCLYELGLQKGGERVSKVVTNFVERNINPNGQFYMIHFDSTSQEQTILLNQWKKKFSIYTDLTDQSPSKKILDKVFEKLTRDNIIEFSCEHLVGEAINYKDEQEYLELFMNFHLETFFNKEPLFEEVKQSILDLGKRYKDKNGKYNIKPGCFIYKIKKI